MSIVIPEGRLIIDVEHRIDLREMRDWPPLAIACYFEGIAMMLRAVNDARRLSGSR